jgi:secondary thiamine-phosphate synthase enzyme
MSKSSTVTARDQPVAGMMSAAGALQVHGEVLTVETDQRIQLIDLTDRVMALVRKLGVKEGTLNLSPMHTTCTVLINEFQAALLVDIKKFLEQVVARGGEWMHNDPAHSDCDRMNADAHLRAMLLGHSLTLQITGGEVVLGQWQRVLLAELDGPRSRTLRAQVMGVV